MRTPKKVLQSFFVAALVALASGLCVLALTTLSDDITQTSSRLRPGVVALDGRGQLDSSLGLASRSRAEEQRPALPAGAAVENAASRAVAGAALPPKAREQQACGASHGSVYGRLVQPDGSGCSDYSLLLQAQEGAVFTAESASDGSFAFHGIPKGSYNLFLMGSAMESFAPPHTTVVAGPVLDLGDIELASPGQIQTRIVDDTGKAVVGARVVCVGYPRGRSEATSDFEGLARFSLPAAGTGRIFAQDPQLGRSNQTFEFGDQRELQLVLRLERPALARH